MWFVGNGRQITLVLHITHLIHKTGSERNQNIHDIMTCGYLCTNVSQVGPKSLTFGYNKIEFMKSYLNYPISHCSWILLYGKKVSPMLRRNVWCQRGCYWCENVNIKKRKTSRHRLGRFLKLELLVHFCNKTNNTSIRSFNSWMCQGFSRFLGCGLHSSLGRRVGLIPWVSGWELSLGFLYCLF